MNSTLPILLTVGLIAGAGGALVTRALVSTANPAETDRIARGGLTPDSAELDAEAISREVESLRRRNDELEMRLAALEQSGTASGREALQSEPKEDLIAMRQRIDDLAAALDDPYSAEALSLRNSVRVAMEQIEEEEDAEREREREERTLERIDERLGELQTELGLGAVQMKSMREVLLTENSQRVELFRGMRDGSVDRGEIREAMGSLRDETQAALGTILTPMQLEDYQELEREERFGGFGRGRGGRGGRGGDDSATD